jgi:gallate decarboxylase subunit D
MITLGTGKHRVEIEKHMMGENILYVLQGGEKPHIGGVVVCEPGEKSNIIRLGTHKDYLVLGPIAEKASERYDTTVVVVGGIHIDNATKEDIDIVVKNCKELESCI